MRFNGTKNYRIQQWVQYCLLFVLSMTSTAILAEEAMWRYSVRPGDNLITLGKTHLINPSDWKKIQQVNAIKNPYRIPVGTVLKVPLALVKKGPANAEVVFVSGNVQWQQSTTSFKPISVGQKLGPGSTIVTKENSKVVIQFADETLTELYSNATLRLDTLSLYSGGAMVDTKLRLQKGKLKTQANPKHIKGNTMRVITPSAIAAVRGTEFRVSANQDETTQETLDGQVALGASDQEVLVNKGYGSKAVLGQAPTPPVVLLPAVDTSRLKETYETLPVTFDMPVLQGASSWVGKISTDKQFNQVVSEAETQGKQLVFSEMPDGQYHLSLNAVDQLGIAGYDALHTFVVNAAPAQPTLMTPLYKDVVREGRPTLKWADVSEAERYMVEVATDNHFNTIVAMKKVAGTELQLDKKLATGTYFWRVSSIAMNAQHEEDRGPAIKMSEFTYKPLPPKPDISQLTVKVEANRVFVRTTPTPEGMVYAASLDNPFNNQTDVWEGSGSSGKFDFLLKEFGKQTLYLHYLDSDGAVGPAAVYEFDAQPE